MDKINLYKESLWIKVKCILLTNFNNNNIQEANFWQLNKNMTKKLKWSILKTRKWREKVRKVSATKMKAIWACKISLLDILQTSPKKLLIFWWITNYCKLERMWLVLALCNYTITGFSQPQMLQRNLNLKGIHINFQPNDQ